MNILNLFRSKPQAVPAPRPITKQSYQVTDGELSIQASTLDGYHKAHAYRLRATEMMEMAKEAQDLISKDGSRADFDPRPHHVVLPKQNFEYNGDTKTFVLDAPHYKVSGSGSTLTVVTEVKTQAVWDQEAGTLDYQTYFVAPGPFTGTPRDAVDNEIFFADGAGKVALPGASSLAEAAQVAPRRALAERAQDLMNAATIWLEAGAKLDGGAADVNPVKGDTVAVDVAFSSLGSILANESALSLVEGLGGEDGLDDVPVGYFDIQSGASDFLVTAGGATMTGKVSDATTEISFDHLGLREQVSWSKADGKVSYQTSAAQCDH